MARQRSPLSACRMKIVDGRSLKWQPLWLDIWTKKKLRNNVKRPGHVIHFWLQSLDYWSEERQMHQESCFNLFTSQSCTESHLLESCSQNLVNEKLRRSWLDFWRSTSTTSEDASLCRLNIMTKSMASVADVMLASCVTPVEISPAEKASTGGTILSTMVFTAATLPRFICTCYNTEHRGRVE